MASRESTVARVLGQVLGAVNSLNMGHLSKSREFRIDYFEVKNSSDGAMCSFMKCYM